MAISIYARRYTEESQPLVQTAQLTTKEKITIVIKVIAIASSILAIGGLITLTVCGNKEEGCNQKQTSGGTLSFAVGVPFAVAMSLWAVCRSRS